LKKSLGAKVDVLEARDAMDEEEVAKRKGDQNEVVQSEIKVVEKKGATKDAGDGDDGAEEALESGPATSQTLLSEERSKRAPRLVEEKAGRIEIAVVAHEGETRGGTQELEPERELKMARLSRLR